MLRDGLVTKEQLEDVLRAQHDGPQSRISGWRLGELLIERGLVTEGQVSKLVAEQYELPYLELEGSAIDENIARLMPSDVADRFSALPIESLPDGSLLLAVADPATVLFSDELRRTLGRPLRFTVVAPKAMESVLSAFHDHLENGSSASVSPIWPSSAVSFDFAVESPDAPADSSGSVESSNGAATPVAAASSCPPLGTLLVRDGLVSEDELETALAQQRLSFNKRLGEILVERGTVTRADIARVVAEQYELPFIDLATVDVDPRIASLLPQDIAERFSALPLDFQHDGSLRVAVADPTKVLSPEEILAVLGARLSFAVADPDVVESAIRELHAHEDAAASAWPTFATIGPPVSGAQAAEAAERESEHRDELVVEDATDLIVGLGDAPAAVEPDGVDPEAPVSGEELRAEADTTADDADAALHEPRAVDSTWATADLVVVEPGTGDAPEALLETPAQENLEEQTHGDVADHTLTTAEALPVDDEGADEHVADATAEAAEIEPAQDHAKRRSLFSRLRRRSDDATDEQASEEGALEAASDPIADLIIAGEGSDDAGRGRAVPADDDRERRAVEQAAVLRMWMAPATKGIAPPTLDSLETRESSVVDERDETVDESANEPAEARVETHDSEAATATSPPEDAFESAVETSDEPGLELDEGETALVEDVVEDVVEEALEEAVEDTAEDAGSTAWLEPAPIEAEVAVEQDVAAEIETDHLPASGEVVPDDGEPDDSWHAPVEAAHDEPLHAEAVVVELDDPATEDATFDEPTAEDLFEADATDELPTAFAEPTNDAVESFADVFRHEAWSAPEPTEELQPEPGEHAEPLEEEATPDLETPATFAAEAEVEPAWDETHSFREEATPDLETPATFETEAHEEPIWGEDLSFEEQQEAREAPDLHAVEAPDWHDIATIDDGDRASGDVESSMEPTSADGDPADEGGHLEWLEEIAPDAEEDEATPWMFAPDMLEAEDAPAAEVETADEDESVVEEPATQDVDEPAAETTTHEHSPSALDLIVAMSVPTEPRGSEDVAAEAAEQVAEIELPRPTPEPTPEPEAEPEDVLATLLEHATALSATTVHFSAQEHGIVVRARVDGVLRRLDTITGSDRFALARELSSAAQAGVLSGGHVTALPTPHGETFAVRFRPSGPAATLDALSLDLGDREALERALGQPFGLVLIAGPAGSGQSGTLSAALHQLTSDERAVMTIEDPVLHVVPGADQVAVDRTAGRGFADGLRQLLSADPDVILVGELGDEETARLAFDAAASHLVASSVQASSTVAAIDRLEALGVDPDLVASTLSVVVAQRLVRQLCDHCREGYYASAADVLALRRPEEEVGRRLLGRSSGCEECGGTGFAGTIGMYEVLVPNDEVRALIAAGAPAAELERAARLAGKHTLADDGVRLCLEGLTTVSEIQRVLGRALG